MRAALSSGALPALCNHWLGPVRDWARAPAPRLAPPPGNVAPNAGQRREHVQCNLPLLCYGNLCAVMPCHVIYFHSCRGVMSREINVC